jgi:uncharacterized protein YhaN
VKLLKAEITGFGKFENQEFVFIEGNQLIFGENEAGKSTLYNFIKYLLFGFENGGKSNRDFKPLSSKRYGGTLWFQTEEYQEVVLTRYNNQVNGVKKNTPQVTISDTGETGTAELLDRLLGTLNKELFTNVFTFQQEQLNELKGLTSEELEKSLFSIASTGSQQLFEQKKNFLKTANALYTPKAKQKELNQKMMELTSLEQMIQEKVAHEEEFQQILESFEQTQKQTTEKQKEYDVLFKQKEELRKKYENLENYQAWVVASEKAKTVELLTNEDVRKLEMVQRQAQKFKEDKSHFNVERERALEKEVGGRTKEFEFYQANKLAIDELASQSLEVVKLSQHAKNVQENLAENQKILQNLSEKWGWNVSLPPTKLDVEKKIWLEEQQKRAQRLENDFTYDERHYATLEEQERSVNQKIKNLQADYPQITEPRSAQKSSGMPPVVPALVALVLAVLMFFLTASPTKFILPIIVLVCGVLGTLVLNQGKRSSIPENVARKFEDLLQRQKEYIKSIEECQENMSEIDEERQIIDDKMVEFVEETHLGRMDKVSTILHSSSDIELFHQKLVQVGNQQTEMQKVEQALSVFQQKLVLVKDWVPLQNKTVEEQFKAVDVFKERMTDKQLEQKDWNSADLTKRIQEVNDGQQKFLIEIQPILAQYKLENIAEIQAFLEKNKENMQTKEEEKRLRTLITGVFDLSEKVQTTTIEENYVKVASHLELLQKELNELNYQEANARSERDRVLGDGTLDDLYQKQANVKDEIKELAAVWTSQMALSQLMDDLINEMSDQTLPQLLENASNYFSILTKGRYREIVEEEEILHLIDEKGVDFRVLDVSTGTKDQLIMALRLGFISNQAKNLSPIIVDDGWLHYDSRRKEQLAQVLVEFGKKQQVIVLSSDEQMGNYYQEYQQTVVNL